MQIEATRTKIAVTKWDGDVDGQNFAKMCIPTTENINAIENSRICTGMNVAELSVSNSNLRSLLAFFMSPCLTSFVF